MTTQEVVQILRSHGKGAFGLQITYKIPLGDKLAKRHPDYSQKSPDNYYKISTKSVVYGCDYYHTAQGREADANGTATHQLPKGMSAPTNPEENGIVLYNTKGEAQIILYTDGRINSKHETHYYVDGKEVSFQDIEDLVNQGVFTKAVLPNPNYNPNARNIFRIGVDRILELKVVKKISNDPAAAYPENIGESLNEARYIPDIMELEMDMDEELVTEGAYIPDIMELEFSEDLDVDDKEENNLTEDYGWEISSGEAWEVYEKMLSILGANELCDALAKAMGDNALADNLAYIARQYDLSEVMPDYEGDEEEEDDFDYNDDVDDLFR